MLMTRKVIESKYRQSRDFKSTIIGDLEELKIELSNNGITTPLGDNEKRQLAEVLEIIDSTVEKIKNVT